MLALVQYMPNEGVKTLGQQSINVLVLDGSSRAGVTHSCCTVYL